MPYKINLIANGHVIYARMLDVVTVQDIAALSQEAAAMVNAQDHKCHYLTDLTHMKMGPTNFIEIRNASKVLLAHPKLADSITYGSTTIGDNVIAKFLTNLMAGLSKVPTKILSTEEEAVNYLIKVSPMLNGILQADLQRFSESQ